MATKNKQLFETLLAAAKYAYTQASDSDISIIYDHELRSDDEARQQLKALQQGIDYCEQQLATIV